MHIVLDIPDRLGAQLQQFGDRLTRAKCSESLISGDASMIFGETNLSVELSVEFPKIAKNLGCGIDCCWLGASL
jgi:hypothetical protein